MIKYVKMNEISNVINLIYYLTNYQLNFEMNK